MDTKKEAKKYLNKYFKHQHINENDDEFKALVRLLKKALKKRFAPAVPDVSKSVASDAFGGLGSELESGHMNYDAYYS